MYLHQNEKPCELLPFLYNKFAIQTLFLYICIPKYERT